MEVYPGLQNCCSLSFQRYRYTEAYQVDLKLQTVEQEFISKSSDSEEVLLRIRSASQWRARLIVSHINFLSNYKVVYFMDCCPRGGGVRLGREGKVQYCLEGSVSLCDVAYLV